MVVTVDRALFLWYFFCQTHALGSRIFSSGLQAPKILDAWLAFSQHHFFHAHLPSFLMSMTSCGAHASSSSGPQAWNILECCVFCSQRHHCLACLPCSSMEVTSFELKNLQAADCRRQESCFLLCACVYLYSQRRHCMHVCLVC